VPYQFKDDVLQRFKVSFASRYFDIVSDKRYNYKTDEPMDFKRTVYSSSVGLSNYKKPLITLEFIGEDGEKVSNLHSKKYVETTVILDINMNISNFNINREK